MIELVFGHEFLSLVLFFFTRKARRETKGEKSSLQWRRPRKNTEKKKNPSSIRHKSYNPTEDFALKFCVILRFFPPHEPGFESQQRRFYLKK